MRLGIKRDRSDMNKVVTRLRNRRPKLVASLHFGVHPVTGKIAPMHALTPKGGSFVEENIWEEGTVPVHKHLTLFAHDRNHRELTIDFHLAVRAWASQHENQVDFFHTYYDPGEGGGRGVLSKKKTRIAYSNGRWIEPDAIFSLTDDDGTQRLFVYELYLGKKANYVVKKLRHHFEAMDENAVEDAYQKESAARFLIVFDTDDELGRIQERLRTHPFVEENPEFFFLSTRERSAADFLDGWQRFDGEPARLFIPNRTA